MGWIDVKEGKLVKKKGKFANCLVTLWESYVFVEPSPQPAVPPSIDLQIRTTQTEAAATAQPTAHLTSAVQSCL